MNELLREYIPDELLKPVKLARLKGQDGGTEGLEISFRESAPEMRDRRTNIALAIIALVTMIPFALLAEPVSTILWIAKWSELDADAKQTVRMVTGGAAIFGIVWWMLTPPFRTAIRIVLLPAQNRLSIYRGGKLAQNLRLSDIRGVRIAPPPEKRASAGRGGKKAEPREPETGRALLPDRMRLPDRRARRGKPGYRGRGVHGERRGLRPDGHARRCCR